MIQNHTGVKLRETEKWAIPVTPEQACSIILALVVGGVDGRIKERILV